MNGWRVWEQLCLRRPSVERHRPTRKPKACDARDGPTLIIYYPFILRLKKYIKIFIIIKIEYLILFTLTLSVVSTEDITCDNKYI